MGAYQKSNPKWQENRLPATVQNPEPGPEAEKPQVKPEIKASQSTQKSWVWKCFVDESKLEKNKIAMEAHYLHNSHSHHIKNVFKNINQIIFTLDAWASPNTISFLAITVHATTNSWDLTDVAIGMPQVHSPSYNITDSLVKTTADNTSNNSNLAARVEKILDGQFMSSEHLLGCMAHVINLAAKDGLQAFGFNTNTPYSELALEQMDNPIHISNITNQPDGVNFNLQKVISCCGVPFVLQCQKHMADCEQMSACTRHSLQEEEVL
ncbi:uncharacterized protein VP01_32g1 [Puccinia sorghi]|uniref:HAT C-terminal dimerisation domain-containing protein n=1 Tax=Puccinia sorghi TaxID=27349 RepID=A0A0L6UZA2_9BASI|nr:uncharacterized protein VP01_32g1 [Puccinia sorghi]